MIGAFAAGGAERFVVDLVRELARLGRKVELLVLSSRRDDAGEAMARSLTEEGIPFEVGPTSKVGVRTVLWYAGALRRRQGAIVHLHTTNTEMIHLLTSWSVPGRMQIFRTIHNTVLPEHGLAGFAFRRLPASLSIACGEATGSSHLRGVSGPFRRIPNGVRFEWLVRSEAESTAAKRSLGLDEARVQMLCVGRMTGESPSASQKGHDVLVQAWQRGRLGEIADLHLLGDGELRAVLESIASGDASIRFHGIQSNVSQWLVAADGFVMPSRWEGLPISAIEAIGTGLPCLFSDISSLRELEGPNVLFSAPDDVSELARKLRDFAESREYPDRETVEEFRTRYGMSRAAREYDEAYREFAPARQTS